MENIIVVLFAVIFYLLIKRIMPVFGVKHKTPSELREQLKDKEKQFVDLRSTETSKQDPIRGFENIPLNELSANVQKLERSNDIVLISNNKREMKKASSKLKRRGYRYVTTVTGGTQNWKNGDK